MYRFVDWWYIMALKFNIETISICRIMILQSFSIMMMMILLSTMTDKNNEISRPPSWLKKWWDNFFYRIWFAISKWKKILKWPSWYHHHSHSPQFVSHDNDYNGTVVWNTMMEQHDSLRKMCSKGWYLNLNPYTKCLEIVNQSVCLCMCHTFACMIDGNRNIQP